MQCLNNRISHFTSCGLIPRLLIHCICSNLRTVEHLRVNKSQDYPWSISISSTQCHNVPRELECRGMLHIEIYPTPPLPRPPQGSLQFLLMVWVGPGCVRASVLVLGWNRSRADLGGGTTAFTFPPPPSIQEMKMIWTRGAGWMRRQTIQLVQICRTLNYSQTLNHILFTEGRSTVKLFFFMWYTILLLLLLEQSDDSLELY